MPWFRLAVTSRSLLSGTRLGRRPLLAICLNQKESGLGISWLIGQALQSFAGKHSVSSALDYTIVVTASYSHHTLSCFLAGVTMAEEVYV